MAVMPMKRLLERSQLSETIRSSLRPVTDEELQRPTIGGHEPPQIQKAHDTSFKDTSERFRVAQRVYTQQYSSIYNCRLNELKLRLKQKATQRWPQVAVANGIKEIQSETDSVILGILYKWMKLKPSVLDQYMKGLDVEAPHESFLSDTDRLYLEDETVRIPLRLSAKHISPNRFVTGLVVACRGQRISTGEFDVVDLTLPGVIAVERPMTTVKLEVETKLEPLYIGFIAGLNLGAPGSHLGVILKGLTAFLLGNTGEADPCARHIIRLVVIGDTFFSSDNSGTSTSYNTAPLKSQSTLPLKALDEADAFFASIAPSLPIDLVPGPNDCTNGSLPQQPLHQALLPQCRKIKTFRSVTNPYSFEIEGIRFLGMASQSVEDILKFSECGEPIDALQLIADAQCLCPTAPDTLPCYPFIDQDPFCFPSDSNLRPHVIFSSGHSSFECRQWNNQQWETQQQQLQATGPVQQQQGPLLVTIPKFSGFKQLVLMDLNTLTCQVKDFGSCF